MDDTTDIDPARVICAFDELSDPGAKGFSLGEGEWPLRGFVVRRGEDVHAYVNHCPHAGFPLNWIPDQFLTPGGELIRCVMHGAMFEFATGECVSGPCLGDALQPLPVSVREGLVVLDESVRLEDPN